MVMKRFADRTLREGGPMAQATLVYEGWSSSADWRCAAARLQAQGTQAVTSDLPSNRDRSADWSYDVQEMKKAIRAAMMPVVGAGWSYGGKLIGGLAGTRLVDRLVHIGSFPESLEATTGEEPLYLANIPNTLFPDEAAVVLRDDWITFWSNWRRCALPRI